MRGEVRRCSMEEERSWDLWIGTLVPANGRFLLGYIYEGVSIEPKAHNV